MTRLINQQLLLGLFLAAACAVFSQIAFAAQAPTVDYLTVALQYQGSAPITVKYKSLAQGDKIRYTYVRTPQARAFIEETDTAATYSSYDSSSGEFRSYTLKKDTKETYGRQESDLQGPFVRSDLLEAADYSLRDAGTVSEWVARGKVNEVQEPIDGASCWRVDVQDPERDVQKYSIWLDANVGFCPRLVEFAPKGDYFGIVRVHFRNYKDLGSGFWYPQQMDQEITNIPGVTEAHYTACDVALTVAQKEQLLVTFPSKTKVKVGPVVSYVVP